MILNSPIDITILCRVIDNFGDAGVVFRLLRSISYLKSKNDFPSFSLRIVIDDLKIFSMLDPKINSEKPFQIYNGWKIYNWSAYGICFDSFKKTFPQIILECFQCGRPDWMEVLLFEKKIKNTVHIIMIDYLTAEDYAETFHKLKSLTRSKMVQKVNFMPGFTSKTGGLILDNEFMKLFKSKLVSHEELNIMFFSYEKDWTNAVKAFSKFYNKNKFNIFAAQGNGFESFVKAWKEQGKCFPLKKLDFVPQLEWDKILYNSDILFIRGEDSFSRACLIGKPFVWHAYPQEKDYQLVKVQAVLEKMRPYFKKSVFNVIEKCWQVYNGAEGNLEESIIAFLESYKSLCDGFYDFSMNLKKNGDLTFNLMTFILKTCIV